MTKKANNNAEAPYVEFLYVLVGNTNYAYLLEISRTFTLFYFKILLASTTSIQCLLDDYTSL
jgi:hypothetical protein